jgi:hypothetical protein
MQADDRRLGLDRPIARRDFFNGVAIAAGAAERLSAEVDRLRGSHPGSFELS